MAATPFALLPHGNSLTGPRDRGARYAGLAAAVLVHAVLIVALLQCAPVRRSIARVAPIMVSVITPPPPEALRPGNPALVELTGCYHNLLRMWAEA